MFFFLAGHAESNNKEYHSSMFNLVLQFVSCYCYCCFVFCLFQTFCCLIVTCFGVQDFVIVKELWKMLKKLKVCSDRSSLVTGVCCQFKMWTIVKKKQPQLSPSTKKKVMPKCKLLLFCVHCLYVGHLTVVACFNLFLLFVCLSFV